MLVVGVLVILWVDCCMFGWFNGSFGVVSLIVFDAVCGRFADFTALC